jgi:hypothetical protein
VVFDAYDEDHSGFLEFNELKLLCDYVYEKKKKEKKHPHSRSVAKEYASHLMQKLDPQNEGIVSQQRFLAVAEEEPDLATMLISENLIDIDHWDSVFKNFTLEDNNLNSSTTELFSIL